MNVSIQTIKDRFMINTITNDGIEPQIKSEKYQYLKDNNNNSLSGMITLLNREIVRNKYDR